MKRRLSQVILFIALSALLVACSKDGDVEVIPEPEFFPPPVPLGPPVYTDIVEPVFVNKEVTGGIGSQQGDFLTMLSYDPETTLIGNVNPAELIDSPDNVIVSLNTVEDGRGEYEFTVFSKSDKIFVVDHDTDVINDIVSSTNAVCEILRSEVPQYDVAGSDVTVNVLDEELVYVVTVEGIFEDCGKADKVHRYLKLPLDFDFTEDTLEFVLEDEARSQLVFGWEDDTDTPAAGDSRLVFGYLGYANVQKVLTFFNADKSVRWQQSRSLEQFDTTGGSLYSFKLTALDNQQYAVQAGKDVFVVDASSEFFAKADEPDELETILVDRVLRLDTSEYAPQPLVMNDATNVLFFDQGKIYRFDYMAGITLPTPSANYTIVERPPINPTEVNHANTGRFSQFDIGDCESQTDEAACDEAHATEATDWQFLTDCTFEFDCEFETVVADFCVTAAEVLVDPSLTTRDRCSPSNYLHISELNDASNDAEFSAFMQYQDFIVDWEVDIDEERLFFNTKLLEKDILLQYNYLVDLAAPKPSRERIILGQRFVYQGLETYVSDGNLYANALQRTGLQTEQCFRDNQLRICDLDNTLDSGDTITCTGLDVANGECTASFDLYESLALFCNDTQLGADGSDLGDGSCEDDSVAPVNNLSVVSDTEDAKWVKMYDARTQADAFLLLVGDKDDYLSQSDNDVVGKEGALYDPDLFFVNGLGVPDASSIGELDGIVESVVGGWLNGDDIGRLVVIETEIIQSLDLDTLTSGGSGPARTEADTHFVLNHVSVGTLENCNDVVVVPAPDGTPCVVNVAESTFDRISR